MKINLNQIEHIVTIGELIDAGITLNKYADPTEPHRTNLTAEEVEEIAREDSGLVYLDILDIYGFGDLLNDLLESEKA